MFHHVLLQLAFDVVRVMLQERFKGKVVHTPKFKGARQNAGDPVYVIGT